MYIIIKIINIIYDKQKIIDMCCTCDIKSKEIFSLLVCCDVATKEEVILNVIKYKRINILKELIKHDNSPNPNYKFRDAAIDILCNYVTRDEVINDFINKTNI